MLSHIVVIGGGIGGLVAATRLAHAGHSVDLFEQGTQTGGKMGRVVVDGCTFDTGPTLITMPFVFERFFASVGERFSDHVTLQRVDPACQYRWEDGSILDLPFDAEAVPDAIERFSPGHGAPVKKYLNSAREIYELTKDVFIFSPFDGFKEFFKRKNLSLLPKLSRLRFTSKLHDVHTSMFSDKRIIQLFDRFATYNGSSPYLAPATLMVIPWVEIGLGAWYPKGGIYAIAEAITQLALLRGVRIHCNTRVASIRTFHGVASGVELEDGSFVRADHVISNADVHVTRTYLLGKSMPEPTDLSCSGLVMLLSVDRQERSLQHHNILFGNDYPGEFHNIRFEQRPRSNSTVYISRSVHSTPSDAPPDRENWFVLVNAPPRGISSNFERTESSVWLGHEEEQADMILDRMETFGLRPHVRERLIRTPDTMATEWSSYRGALYGASSNSMFSAFLRPRQRSTDVANLWYVGGSSHPGGGVPLVITSGMIAADLLLSSLSTP
ncbi:MAG: phytoene desaturase [Ignavibacteria bacterium]|nr:phytoene desaturase [Ignavibacteria bacterium]